MIASTLLLSLVAALLPQTGGDPLADPGMPVAETSSWAVLADGRLKPLETLATETMASIVGRERIGELDPIEFLWSVHFDWAAMQQAPVVKVNSSALKSELGLDEDERRFSYRELFANLRFRELVESGGAALDAEGDPSALERDALDVYARLERLNGIAMGMEFRLVPPLSGGEASAWRTPSSLSTSAIEVEQRVFQEFGALAQAWTTRNADAFSDHLATTADALRAVNPEAYPQDDALSAELTYNRLNAFGRAWQLYLLGFLALALFGRSPRKIWYGVGMGAIVLGFVGHTVGLGLRWQIAGRAPVSDMYESLVFMGWGAILIGLVLEFFSRKRYFGIAAALTGFLALAFAENLPVDSSINPLVPVLANTSWLSIHVMTIMLSYSAFAIAMTMGHVVLFMQFFQPGRTQQLRSLSGLLYKCLQVGVLFLAAGIAFGAIWANESWGRYWGWDPKETWSLITFFVYLIVIHARFAGWVSNFGLAVSSIAGFLAVVMTYYGVNFVLAAGLHSYGFSEGGMIWALAYFLFEMAVILGALIRYRSARASLVSDD